MSKNVKRCFYRPHARVRELGEIFDPATGVYAQPPSMTKQEFVKECDINNIIKSYSTTGMLNHVSARAAAGAYEDLPDSYDFQESLHQVQAAERAFMTLPAKLRDRFENQPAQFLAFCADPANMDEMRALGLARPAEAPMTSIDVETPPTGPKSAPTTTKE